MCFCFTLSSFSFVTVEFDSVCQVSYAIDVIPYIYTYVYVYVYIYFLVLCRMLRSPSEYMQPFCDAVTEATRAIDPKYLKEGEQVLVGFEGPFVSRRVTPRDLLSQFIGSMVCVEGIVTKCKITLPYFFFVLFFVVVYGLND